VGCAPLPPPYDHPRRAASIFATSIFCIVIIASNARSASAPPMVSAAVRTVESARVPSYIVVMSPAVKSILERVASWPAEDQEELSELARAIEARRSGVYRLSDEERVAIDAARRSPLVSDDEVEAFWKRRGLA
jgi:hypothetical protein